MDFAKIRSNFNSVESRGGSHAAICDAENGRGTAVTHRATSAIALARAGNEHPQDVRARGPRVESP